MIVNEKPDIIGHIDKISMNMKSFIPFDNHPKWYVKLLSDLLEHAAKHEVIVELNLRGLIKQKWPTSFIDERYLPLCRELGVNMIISTDAHHPSEVNKYYDYGVQLLKKRRHKTYDEIYSR